MAEFNHTIQQLGNQPRMATVVSMATNNTAVLSRDTVRLTLNTSDGTSLTVPGTNLVPMNTSRQTQCAMPKKPATEVGTNEQASPRNINNRRHSATSISHTS